MESKRYYFLVTDSEFKSFLSFCEVNNINFCGIHKYGGETFVLEDNKIKKVVLSDEDSCSDWDDFIEEYYADLWDGESTATIISYFKDKGFSFDENYFVYNNLWICPDDILGCYDNLHYELLEIIFNSNHPCSEKDTTKSKSYLDFNHFN